MTDSNVFVGIDICLAHLDVFISNLNQTHCFDNNSSGVSQLVTLLSKVQPTLVALESTGGLERLVINELNKAHISIARVNPRQVRAYAVALGKAKTDILDAKVLAHFAQNVRPQIYHPPDEDSQRLTDLVTRRRQLVEMQVAEKNRLCRCALTIKPEIEEHIDYLQLKIEQLNRQIEKLTKSQHLVAKQNILLSAPGIGSATCAVCLAELPELGNLTDKQIARLVGVAPINRDSGQFRGKRMIEGGRAHVRAALYMATLVATRHNPTIRDFYQRLLDRGKLKKVALTACLRKFLIILNAMIRDGKLWQYQNS